MAIRPMTADAALAGMKGKLEAKDLPPGLIPAILEAIISLFSSFCPAMSPAPDALQATAKTGLEAYQAGNFTLHRYQLKRVLRRHIGFFNRSLDDAERACWEIGAETPQDEIARYAATWQGNRPAPSDDQE